LASESDIRRILVSRFGTNDQEERFRDELRNRRRRPDESISALYIDIRRLLALLFPGESGDLYEEIRNDYFLDALADPALRTRVLDQMSKTLRRLTASCVV